ncbi:Auxin-induced protein X15 [Morella rubra]|uniref:Auxin-induced protein X15 n=1 Tax=Morella rubra TaxID=262757 RepID=A0A6A1VZ43_9ROSI|nr:Auxin-induced protein X15 [Morella rubra]KAB1218244.1 Auxin-induced protein X15 [Morella rubra]
MINNWSRSVHQHLPTTLNPCTTTHWRFTQEHPKEGEQKQQLFFQQASFMDSTKSNKIREIVRLQQILKKWKKLANAPKNSSNTITCSPSTAIGNKSIKFLKRTLSFSDTFGASNDVVPKGFLAVCVGKELKRFIIPTEYLGHQAFGMLLREAEEEFGFQQEGVLKIPCEVSVFEKILKVVEEKREVFFLDEFGYDADKEKIGCSSPDCELTSSHLPQMCR